MALKLELDTKERALSIGQWFVYLYSDPRPDCASRPLYVGISRVKRAGSAKRMRYHWRMCGKHRNNLLARFLEKIKRVGLSPKMEIVAVFDTEIEAKSEEMRLIALYGKRIDRSGTLCNLTDGGDGALGFVVKHTEAFKRRVGEVAKQRWSDPAYKARVAQSVKDFHAANPEAVVERSEKTKAAWTSEKRQLHAEKTTQRLSTPAVRERISAGVLANTAALTAAGERIKQHATDPALLAKRSEAIKEAFQDPVLRKKLSKVGKAFWNSSEGQALKSEMMTELWKDPAYREKMTAERAARWKDAQFAAKSAAGTKRGIAAMSPERKAELARKRSEAAKRRWANPEWRKKTMQSLTTPEQCAKNSERLHARWSDPKARAELLAARAANTE